MRFFTFSILRNCKFKFSPQIPRFYSQCVSKQTEISEGIAGDPSYLEVCDSWPTEEEPALRASLLRDMRILPNFVSEQEEASLLAELEPVLKRMRYEFDHWDNAIQGYRETERAQWSESNAAVLSRVRSVAFAERDAGEPLPHAHVLDLAAAGHIKPHIDAVRFCGGVIAGVCLHSSAVMRLQHPKLAHLSLDALLERRCLYIMRGVARYDVTHAVLGGTDSRWRGQPLPRQRRVAVILRQRPPPAAANTEDTPA